MNKSFPLLLLAAVSLPLPLVAAPEMSAQNILDCAGNNAPEESFSQAAAFEVSDDSGAVRHIRANFAGQRTDKGLLLNVGVKAPQDVAGTAVLLRRNEAGEDDLKIYLPALRRVRSVSGAMASQGLLGTDFSYRDLKDIFGSFRDGKAELLVANEQSQQLAITPPAEQVSPYQRILASFDSKTCVPLELIFETAEQGEVKRLTGDPESLTQIGSRNMLLIYTMVDKLKGSQTKLILGAPMIDEKISRSAFNSGTFYNFHNRAEEPE